MEDTSMNKEEILAMSRNENKGKDIEKLEAESKARSVASYAASLYALVMFVTEYYVLGKGINFSLWAVIVVIAAAEQAYMYIRLRKKKHLVEAILCGILAIALTVATLTSFLAR